jgi:polyhydroxyalkanoate synthesis regulator phasin
MTDETRAEPDTGTTSGAETETEAGAGPEPGKARSRGSSGSKGRGGRMGDGIRQGIGVLSAFKEALEETIQEARDRGDLSTDRAREVMKEALGRAQAAAEGAKERLDFAHADELEALQATVQSLRARLSALEEQVFGAARDDHPGEGATYAEPEAGAPDGSPAGASTDGGGASTS